MPVINDPVPGAREFYPLNEPAIGTVASSDGAKIPHLFQPLNIRGVTFKNRIFVAPMCQYSAADGHVTDWHLVHMGGFALRGVGAICMEATAVLPEGRISPEDAGIWADSHIEPFKRVVDFAHAQGTKIGIQLAHAGRKASTYALWLLLRRGWGASSTAQVDEGGWPDDGKFMYGPSEERFSEAYPQPKEMSEEHLQRVEDAFVAAVERCKKIGFDFIELHGAHGYLIHSFVSPVSNTRTDQYGGSLENRLRFPTRVLERMRLAWGDKPLFLRISASDRLEVPEKADDGTWTQWGVEQSTIWVGNLMRSRVIDLLDVSSGGNAAMAPFFAKEPGFQVPYSEAIKKALPDLIVGAVGNITEAEQAESYLSDGKADVIFLARELLRNADWALSAAKKLGFRAKPANQYETAWV